MEFFIFEIANKTTVKSHQWDASGQQVDKHCDRKISRYEPTSL
jgi:hypothetical protein